MNPASSFDEVSQQRTIELSYSGGSVHKGCTSVVVPVVRRLMVISESAGDRRQRQLVRVLSQWICQVLIQLLSQDIDTSWW